MVNRARVLASLFLVFAIPSLWGCAVKTEPDYAFQTIWTKPHADWRKYTEIAVGSVDTAEVREADTQALATYTEQALKNALRRYPHPRLQLVNSPGPKTVILDTALIGWAEQASGEFGMESKLRDARSGEVLASIHDRETAMDAPVQSVVDAWALQLASLMNSHHTPHSPFRTVYHPWPAIMYWH
ncbi:MAG: DUF3313 family protein [Candidatus Binatia bacterium]